MANHSLPIPLSYQHQALIGMAFTLVDAHFNEEDDAFTKAVMKALDAEQLEEVRQFMCKFKANEQEELWTVELIPDMFAFFISLDLINRFVRFEYFTFMMNEAIAESENSHTGVDPTQIAKETIGNISTGLLTLFSNYSKRQNIVAYLFEAERFPDPLTGISQKLAAYNHLPKIPNDSTPFYFNNYDDEEWEDYDELLFDYHLDSNPFIVMKDYCCIISMSIILEDRENPPAKIIAAYFPDLESMIGQILEKLNKKTKKKRKKIELKQGEYGALYACSDLFGKISASSYHYLLTDLDEMSRLNELEADISKTFDGKTRIEFLRGLVDVGLKLDNQANGDVAVIDNYRAAVAKMIWFDD
jgi:hypothetical protein